MAEARGPAGCPSLATPPPIDPYCDDMDEDQGLDRQFSQGARESYAQRAEALLAALRKHIDLTLNRTARQRELESYFTSQSTLIEAARAFDSAEFDWCGSFPLGLPLDDDEDDEDWDDDVSSSGEVLSVIGRWDYRVTDEDALVDAGRRAYLAAWPDDTQEDAEYRVTDARSAAGEILHDEDLAALSETLGLLRYRFLAQILTHVGDDDFENDPFGLITSEGGD